jgi:hypothetical protein
MEGGTSRFIFSDFLRVPAVQKFLTSFEEGDDHENFKVTVKCTDGYIFSVRMRASDPVRALKLKVLFYSHFPIVLFSAV